jgi:hypothetical protein
MSWVGEGLAAKDRKERKECQDLLLRERLTPQGLVFGHNPGWGWGRLILLPGRHWGQMT